MKIKTVTVFRKWPDGGVIALFPMELATHRVDCCMSYEHVGQHGEASVYITRGTRPATRKEAAPLLAELKRIGYVPEVRSRIPANAWRVRYAASRQVR